jgi:hypothetical protein
MAGAAMGVGASVGVGTAVGIGAAGTAQAARTNAPVTPIKSTFLFNIRLSSDIMILKINDVWFAHHACGGQSFTVVETMRSRCEAFVMAG